jgi:PAS domain S-box-containing protein
VGSQRFDDDDFAWLSGGGEMGARMRALDWSRTALGPMSAWSRTLKTSITIALSSPVPIVMLWGPDGIMIYNDAYSEFAGARHPKLLGSPVLDGWPEVADFNRRVMEVGLSGGTLSFRDQHLVLNRHGSLEDVWMDLSYSPIRDERGVPCAVLAVVVETTERVLAGQKVRDLNATLERQVHALSELDRAKTSFFNLAIVYRNELRLMKLVNALLDFSRIEAGRLEPRHQAIDLARLTLDLAEAFRPAVERAGLVFDVSCPLLPETVYVDPVMWEQIVLNLLSNALKFTFDGSIAVSLRDAGQQIELQVRDTGVGIAEDQLPRLFERFHRIEGVPSRTQEGSGIGLALVNDLVRLHEGTITASSAPGAGATFTVRISKGAQHLPFADAVASEMSPRVSVHAATFLEEAARWGGGAADAGTGATITEPSGEGTEWAVVPGRVLVADDNVDMRDYVSGVLARHWTVETAPDGAAALAAIRAHPPDLVVTDAMMPALDGFGLLRALRSDPRTAHLPVIILSARAGEEARIEGLQHGADDYLVKPFSARELVARVNAHLRLAHAASEMNRLREAAEAANRAKDEFLAMLGHELRNPLAPMLTALQLLKLRGIAAAERERGVLERQVKHLVSLVDDLLDVSRITRGKIDLRRRRVESATFIARAIEMTSPLLEQQRHDLTVDVPRSGLAVHGDEGRLAQVVANLLTNAAKYTEPGGTISVSGRVEGDQVVIAVRDSGAGIEPEMLPVIFDMFVQQRQTLERSRGGLGLGLTIVRSLVELHGGSVSVASDGKDQGSEFTVRLPRLAAATDAPSRAPERPLQVAPAPHPVRVLIVDDNEEYAELLAETLSALGYQTRYVHDAPSALDVGEEFAPDVALLDIGLPVMDGYELARRFTRHPQLRRARLIAVTGYGQERDRTRSLSAGFTAHLVKPVELEALRTAIDDARI